MNQKPFVKTYRQFGQNQPQPPPEKSQTTIFFEELSSIGSEPNKLIALFIKHISKIQEKNQSIVDVVKTGLREKFRFDFEQVTEAALTCRLTDLLMSNITDERNKKSNPSVFLKFIGINNLKHLRQEQANQIIDVALCRLNCYISCDKNIFFLISKLLKVRFDVFSETKKSEISDKILHSLYVYFLEIHDPVLRKDREIIMNYISHFKILSQFLGSKILENYNIKDQENLLQITLNSLFIGSSMEEGVFKSLEHLRKQLIGQKQSNGFYFQENQKRFFKRI